MSAPLTVTLDALSGKWELDKALSSPTDPILSLQGMNWVIRKAIGMSSVILDIKQTKETSATTKQPISYLEILQTSSTGLPGTTERRWLDWEPRNQEDHIFGKCAAQLLQVSLEDLMSGTEKQVLLSVNVYEGGRITPQPQKVLLKVKIEPGLQLPRSIKYAGVGDEYEKGHRQDVYVFVHQEKHPVFERKGDDLITYIDIDQVEARYRWDGTISSINGKKFRVSHLGSTEPGYRKRIRGDGMGKLGEPEQRGDLIVRPRIVQ